MGLNLNGSVDRLNGWYARALSPAYFGAINRRGNTQFRLRFAMPSNKNSTANYLSFHSGNLTTTPSLRATLVIKYYVP